MASMRLGEACLEGMERLDPLLNALVTMASKSPKSRTTATGRTWTSGRVLHRFRPRKRTRWRHRSTNWADSPRPRRPVPQADAVVPARRCAWVRSCLVQNRAAKSPGTNGA